MFHDHKNSTTSQGTTLSNHTFSNPTGSSRERSKAFPLLTSMRLNDDEFLALQRQGFVSREQRHSRTIFKLRFRIQGRQRVKYLRADRVAEVLDELHRLQANVRREIQSEAQIREARRLLRSTKQDLIEPAAELGFFFHGLALRRRRAATAGKFLKPKL